MFASNVTSANCIRFVFFFNDTATTEIYTLSLHDALPISRPRGPARRAAARVPARPARRAARRPGGAGPGVRRAGRHGGARLLGDRESTRLNSSHSQISYAVFCLQKKMDG